MNIAFDIRACQAEHLRTYSLRRMNILASTRGDIEPTNPVSIDANLCEHLPEEANIILRVGIDGLLWGISILAFLVQICLRCECRPRSKIDLTKLKYKVVT